MEVSREGACGAAMLQIITPSVERAVSGLPNWAVCFVTEASNLLVKRNVEGLQNECNPLSGLRFHQTGGFGPTFPMSVMSAYLLR